MNKPNSKQRRQVLLSAGALLANAALNGLPTCALAARGVGARLQRVSRRSTASIVGEATNPYFVAQGSPWAGTTKLPAVKAGTGAAALDATPQAASPGAAALGAAPFAAAAASGPSTLVLYDTTNTYGWLGELYAIMAANLSSHFGTWTALPVVSYTAGLLNGYTACVYIGSTYGEPLPTAFLADVYAAAATKIIWIYDNIWQLTALYPGFAARFGWQPWVFDNSTVAQVSYKGQSLKRYSANGAGIMTYSTLGSAVTVLAQAVRADGTSFPWAVRSGNLTYIGENPFVYMSEGDRYLILADLLFDALAPATATQHRALVRFEDIHPLTDTAALTSAADWLYANKIPFGFHVTTRYLDPNGYYTGVPEDVLLRTQTAMVSAIKYMQRRGGVMICHGYTHQYSNVINPYTAVTGDDCEFYRITSSNGVLSYIGPLPPDTSSSWSQGRFSSFNQELAACGLRPPSLVTFPAYAASAYGYQAAARTFATRAERSLYFKGVLAGGAIDYTRLAGQFFPYTVRDVYGSRVLADTLGGIDPSSYFGIPPRLPADIIADAQRTLVVRDGYASFFYNPEDTLSYLQQTVTAVKALGYQFISPQSA